MLGENATVIKSTKVQEIIFKHKVFFDSLYHLYQSIDDNSQTIRFEGNEFIFSIEVFGKKIPIHLPLEERNMSDE